MKGVSGTMNLLRRSFQFSLDMGVNAFQRKSSVLSSTLVKQSFLPFGRFPDQTCDDIVVIITAEYIVWR